MFKLGSKEQAVFEVWMNSGVEDALRKGVELGLVKTTLLRYLCKWERSIEHADKVWKQVDQQMHEEAVEEARCLGPKSIN